MGHAKKPLSISDLREEGGLSTLFTDGQHTITVDLENFKIGTVVDVSRGAGKPMYELGITDSRTQKPVQFLFTYRDRNDFSDNQGVYRFEPHQAYEVFEAIQQSALYTPIRPTKGDISKS